VDMVDGLAAVFAGVDHGAIALRQSVGTGNFGSCPMKVADQRVVLLARMGNRRNVFAWNDQDVHGRLWIDVAKGIALVVLIDGFGRDASFDNPAEEAAHCGFSLHEWRRFERAERMLTRPPIPQPSASPGAGFKGR